MYALFNEDAVPFVALGPLLDPQQLAHQRTPLIQEDVGLSERLEQVRGVLVPSPSHEVARVKRLHVAASEDSLSRNRVLQTYLATDAHQVLKRVMVGLNKRG